MFFAIAPLASLTSLTSLTSLSKVWSPAGLGTQTKRKTLLQSVMGLRRLEKNPNRARERAAARWRWRTWGVTTTVAVGAKGLEPLGNGVVSAPEEEKAAAILESIVKWNDTKLVASQA